MSIFKAKFNLGPHSTAHATGCAICLAILMTQMPPLAASDLNGPVKVENALLKTIESTSLAAEVAGKIDRLNVVEGDPVKIGQLLGKIRDSAVCLQVERAKIAMAIARKKQRSDIDLRLAEERAAVARNELERAENANERIENTYPPKEVDRLKLVASSAELEIERAKYDNELLELDVMTAENDFRQAEELLSRHQIKSPAVGIVVAISRRVGEWVEPGTELLQIVKIDRLRVEGFVSGAAATRNLMHSSANVKVLTDVGEKHVVGKVVFVSPDANPVNGRVRVYLEIDNSDGEFRPGMRVEATIESESDKQAHIQPAPKSLDPQVR